MAASYFKLTLRYEHLLGDDGEHFTAFNMIHGPFGSGTDASRVDKDHLCVQSLDGRLQFFDQDRFAFTQPLNNSFLPGPICYADGMDAIVAATSDLQVECYRYQVLASASLKQKKPSALDSDAKATSSSASANNSIHCDWKVNLGEAVLDIRTGRCYYQENSTTFDILVLGEFTLFAIKPHGELFLQHRLGGHPSTMCLYPRSTVEKGGGSGAMENLIVASHSKIWSVYKAKTLIWSACAPTVPVAMHVAGFGPIDGMIVSLNGDGALSVNYMGTDPPTAAVVSTEVKEINYEVMDEEHRQLLHVIRRSQGEKRTEPKDRLLVRAQMPVVLDATSANDRRQHHHSHNEFKTMSNTTNNSDPNQSLHGAQVTMRIYVTSTSTSRISDVTLSISTPEHVVANETSFVIDSIDGKTTTPLIIPVVLRPSAIGAMPTTQDLVIAASYTLESGQPRVSQCRVKLPMCLLARLVPPVKSSTFKFTLETNQDPQELTQLFEDMLHQPFCTPEWAKQIVGGGTNVMSFQYYNGVDATILVSKNAGRYRIQSNELEALWMVSRELVDRLRATFASRTGAGDAKEGEADGGGGGHEEPLEIFYQEPLPLADFFGAIDTHFMLRRQRLEISAEINDRAHQLRVIQKRLLVRYKDRNPAAIHCLDVLLHGTYEQLLTLSHSMEDVERRVVLAGNRLACCVHLILLLIQFRFHLDDANAQLLACYLSPVVHHCGSQEGRSVVVEAEEQGWEERTEAAMTELLRTLLAKQQPNAATTTAAATNACDLQMPEDTKKLKKHITIVCDRLGKGANLCGGSAAPADPAEAKA